MLKPATRLAGLSYGLRGALPQLADDLEQRGRSIIRLHLGDPGAHRIPAPPVVLDAIQRCLHDSCSYSPTQGLPAARTAIASYYQDSGLALTPADILLGNGVSELVLLALQALLNPGDEVLVPTPGYPLWPAAIHLAGGTPIPYRCDEQAGWQPDPDHLTSQISPRTVALVANTPHNPTGAIWGAAVLRVLANIARRHRLVLMSDEIYAHIVYDTKHTILATLAPDLPCVTFNGLSKTCCIPGFRSAWMAVSGPRTTTRAYTQAVTQLASLRLCPNVPAQHAITPALHHIHNIETSLTGPAGPLRQRHDAAWEALSGIPGLSCVRPQGAFYLFPRIPYGVDDRSDHDNTVAHELLHDYGVLISPGSDFHHGRNDHIRLCTLADPFQLKEAMTRIASYFAAVT